LALAARVELADSGDDEVGMTVVALPPATVVFGVTAAGASAAAVLLATDGVVVPVDSFIGVVDVVLSTVVELPPPIVDELFPAFVDGVPYT